MDSTVNLSSRGLFWVVMIDTAITDDMLFARECRAPESPPWFGALCRLTSGINVFFGSIIMNYFQLL